MINFINAGAAVDRDGDQKNSLGQIGQRYVVIARPLRRCIPCGQATADVLDGNGNVSNKALDDENRPLLAFQVIAGILDDSEETRIWVVERAREKAPLASVCVERPSELTETAARAAPDTESVTTPLMVSLTCAERTETNNENTIPIKAPRTRKDFLHVKTIKKTFL